MKKIVLLFTVFLIFLLPNWGFGQNGIVKGFVYDDSDGEPIGFCAVQLKGTPFGAMTERNGSFVISKIPKGEYTLVINFFGYDSLVDNISINENTVIKRYLLQPSKVFLEAVQVSGEAKRVITETRTAVISISPKEMTKMPSIGGQPILLNICKFYPVLFQQATKAVNFIFVAALPYKIWSYLTGCLS